MATKSSSTRNRRPSNSAPKGNARSAKAETAGPKAVAKAVAREGENKIVSRRIALVSDNKARKAAAKRFAAGEKIAVLAKDLGVSVTHAAYALRQELVESGSVARIAPSDVKAIVAARREQDAAWVACRTGLTPMKVDAIVAEA